MIIYSVSATARRGEGGGEGVGWVQWVMEWGSGIACIRSCYRY